jgi:ureidoacrylate peracid hydrolase
MVAESEDVRMHELSLPADLVARVTERAGRPHPFDVIEPTKTAFVVVDMQNYFMKPGFQGEVPKARAIVPSVNRLAAALRALGGHVVWIKNATNDTRDSWSVYHDWLQAPERRDRRYASMDLAHEGHALWPELDVRPEDAQIVKKRFSAFLPG